MVDFDFWMGCLGAMAMFTVGLPAKLIDWDSWRHGRTRRLKELREVAIALEVSGEQDLNLKRFAEELGSEALVGGFGLDHAQRLAVLRMKDTSMVLKRYARARSMVTLQSKLSRFDWSSKRFESFWYRRALKWIYFGMYLLCCVAAFAPMLVVNGRDPSSVFVWPPATIQVVCMLCFLPVGVLCLLQSVGVGDAEFLVALSSGDSIDDLSDQLSEG